MRCSNRHVGRSAAIRREMCLSNSRVARNTRCTTEDHAQSTLDCPGPQNQTKDYRHCKDYRWQSPAPTHLDPIDIAAWTVSCWMIAAPGAVRSATTLSTRFGCAQLSTCSLLTPFRNPNTSSNVLRLKGSKPVFSDQRNVPAGWMGVLAALDEVDPCVTHRSCARLEIWVERNCFLRFLDGAGGPFSSDPVL